MAEQGSDEQEEQRSTGTVKWFNPRKGYGFITPAEGEEEVFVHQSDINVKGFRSLAEGADVEFTPERSPDGRLKATRVTGPDGSTVKTGSRPFAGGRGRRRVPRVAVPIQLVYPQYGLGAPGVYGGMYNSSGMGYAASYGGAVPAQPQMQPTAQAFGTAGAPAYGQGMPVGYYSYGYPSVVAPPAATGMVAGVQARPGPSAAERFGSQFRAVVHNLPWEVSKSELFAAFSQWNPQDAHVMIDHRTGQSKGYGIVTFSSEQDLAAAIQGAHGAAIGDPGRIVSVRQDQHM